MSTALQKSNDLSITNTSFLPIHAESAKPIYAPVLSKEQREIVLAGAQGTMIAKMDPEETTIQLKDIVIDILLDLGAQLNDDNMEEYGRLILTVAKDIKRDFGNLTLSEVRLALKRGARGLYGHQTIGQNFGVNAVNFYNWMLKYKEEERGKARRAQLDFLEKQEQAKQEAPSSLEKRITLCRNILTQYREYCAGKPVYVVRFAARQHLVVFHKLKLFRPTKAMYDDAVKKADEQMKMEATGNLSNPSFRSKKKDLLNIVNGILDEGGKFEKNNRAHVILIKQYFEQCRSTKTDLQSVIFFAILGWRKSKNKAGYNWLERMKQKYKS